MTPAEREKCIEEKIEAMTADAKELQRLVKERKGLIDEHEKRLAKEKKDRKESLDKVRNMHTNMRSAKNDAKEQDRQAVSRTLMTNLVTSADYPDAPAFVPHLINVIQNILGNTYAYTCTCL